MATVAVFVALGGGAIAATSLTSSDGTITACVAKKSGDVAIVAAGRKCARGTRRLTWTQTGRPGAQGQPGLPGGPGVGGPPGADGSARGYAHVLASGKLDVPNSKGVNGISEHCADADPCAPSGGASAFQCFDLTFTPQNAVASTAVFAGAATVARVQIPGVEAGSITAGCPPGYIDTEVYTYDTSTGLGVPGEFWILFN
jgi:hypothetical protein